jgi:O-methyltransferase
MPEQNAAAALPTTRPILDLRNRYIELLKSSVLNELYLENELRFLYIFTMMATQQKVDVDVVRNISSRLTDWFQFLKAARQDGSIWWLINVTDADGGVRTLDLRNTCEFSHTMVGRKRLDNIQSCLDIVRADNIPGDAIEAGVWRGGACIFMRGYFAAWEMSNRVVWVADSFEGVPVPSLPEDIGHDMSAARVPVMAIPLEEVQENFRRYGLLDGSVRFLKGWFRDTLPSAQIDTLALLRLDGDLYESTMDTLNALYDKVAPGGFVIVDDYGVLEPCRRAVNHFREMRGIVDGMETIDWTGVFWRKTH